MKWFNSFNTRRQFKAIGLMSGTSADGLDMACITINTSDHEPTFVLEHFFSPSYPYEIKQKILSIAAPNGGSIEDVCRLNFFLGHYFSKLVLDFLQKIDIAAKEIDFIGSHGQTVCHLPEKITDQSIHYGSTLQIGDPSIIANQTGILTVGDFRIADMALGGEGAPLIPIFDYLYFRHPQKNRVVLNIGGIANFTFLIANAPFEHLLAFDTGPGNVLMDTIAQKFFTMPFDQDGNKAKTGQVNGDLLGMLLQDNYFSQKPPKSTGREKFVGPVLQEILTFIEQNSISREDLLSTVTEFTARTIFEAAERFLSPLAPIEELIVSGGGAKNRYLMQRLADYFHRVPVLPSDKYNLLGDAKEAICFAILAYNTLNQKSSNLPSVTGATRRTILGKICIPFPESTNKD